MQTKEKGNILYLKYRTFKGRTDNRYIQYNEKDVIHVYMFR